LQATLRSSTSLRPPKLSSASLQAALLAFTSLQSTKLSSTSLHAMWLPCMQGQLKKPRFEDGLEGVLHLANSVSLTDTLKAADLDDSVGQARGMTPLGALDAVGGAVNDVLSPV